MYNICEYDYEYFRFYIHFHSARSRLFLARSPRDYPSASGVSIEYFLGSDLFVNKPLNDIV